MTITLSRNEVLSQTSQPFESLSVADKRKVAGAILRSRPGDWGQEIKLLQLGIPAANQFVIQNTIASS